jgi:release factor glutamine methyltransferase
MTIDEALWRAVPLLKTSCENPLFEAELLLAHHLGRERLYLHAHSDETIEDIDGFRTLIKRREAHEPYEYIVGKCSFYDIELEVEAGVLIPRPETELLINEASVIIDQQKITHLVEIGVGSGAISIVLARKFPQLEITATDISEAALRIARKNSIAHGVAKRITFVKSNLMDEVKADAQMVVSNPPYIANDFRLEKNVFEYEPHCALFGGEAGHELLAQILHDTNQRGVGWLVCEMGCDQFEPIQKLFSDIGVKYQKFYQDLAGLDRGFVVGFNQ